MFGGSALLAEQTPAERSPTAKTLLVDDGSAIAPLACPEPPLKANPPYRLYRFLTDLDDILASVSADRDRLQQICPLVRRLLEESFWLQWQYDKPHPKTGWSVSMVYEEPEYPLTVQMVAWQPGATSPIHNHGAWGLVALLDGEEKHTFWRRSPDSNHPDRVEAIETLVLQPGDIIVFLPDAIHCVEALGDRETVSFNLYGVRERDRFRFDPTAHTKTPF